MMFLKSLLSPRSRSSQEAQVNQVLSKAGVEGKEGLKQVSFSVLIQFLSKSNAPDKFMKTLLGKIEELDKDEELLKLLSLMHGGVCVMEYQGDILDALQNLTLALHRSVKNEERGGWFKVFYRSYVSYLAKMPSVSDVYIRAKKNQQKCGVQRQLLLVDMFRIVNQLFLILDALILAFTTVGRYYRQAIAVYQPIYKLFRDELTMLYHYMRNIVERLFSDYQRMEADDLKMFLESIQQLQIMTDKMQEFLMCKYFEGNKIDRQLYFKADEIEKITYHLHLIEKKKK